MLISVKTNKLGKFETEDEKVLSFLIKQRGNAFTVAGIMVKLYGVKGNQLTGHFSNWSKANSNLYNRTHRLLKRLENASKASSKQHGRATVYYTHLTKPAK